MYYNGEDVLKKRLEIRDNIAKSLGIEGGYDEIEKARNVGDMHPNGKWVWKEYKPGKFDWRVAKKGGVGKKTTAPAAKGPGKKSSNKNRGSRTGLSVYPATENDRVAIENLINNEGYTAEWNEEWGCYFFEEEPDLYDALEIEIQAGLGYEINCTFEGE